MASFAKWKSSVFFIVAILIAEVLFKYIVLDLYCCVGMNITKNTTKCNGYFTFQMIIDGRSTFIWGIIHTFIVVTLVMVFAQFLIH